MLGIALVVLGYLYLDRVLAAEVEDSLANATTGITGRRRKPSLEILFFSNSSEAARVARCRRFPPPFGVRSKSKGSPGISSLARTVASAAPVGGTDAAGRLLPTANDAFDRAMGGVAGFSSLSTTASSTTPVGPPSSACERSCRPPALRSCIKPPAVNPSSPARSARRNSNVR